MKKNLFLSSVLVMGMVPFGAYAADELITGGAGTCTVDVLGVSDNNATANTIAVWSINEYTLAPGEYLNVTETSVDKTQCPAGSYCVGGTNFTVDNAATSIATCPTEYPNSAAGAGAQNQCYTTCTVATANIAHATAVAGNDYFGDGVDACYATACDTGYHVDGDIELVEKTPLIPVNYEIAGNNYESIAQGGTASDADTAVGLSAQNTFAVDYDYGRVYGKASCQVITDPAHAYFFNNMDALVGGAMTTEEFRSGALSVTSVAKADMLVDFVEAYKFLMIGEGNMTESELEKAFVKFFASSIELSSDYSTDSSGQYCYCQLDGYQANTDTKVAVTVAPWVFLYDYGSVGNCASNCADYCANSLDYYRLDARAFRAVVFGVFEAKISATCTANTINIDWNPDNGGEHTKNMCTYDGEITLPTPDPVKPGYTFTGWKLVE